MSAANLEEIIFGGSLGSIGFGSFSGVARKVIDQICKNHPSIKFDSDSYIHVMDDGRVLEFLKFVGPDIKLQVGLSDQNLGKFGSNLDKDEEYYFFQNPAEMLNVWMRPFPDYRDREGDTKFDQKESEYREFLQREEEANLLNDMFHSEDQTFPESARPLYRYYIEQGFYE